jgi:lipopolysaccharide/colanic/teichoic acid biosynthesis glycosyltransferase/protein involved in polysaccharide export with SLBB domain
MVVQTPFDQLRFRLASLVRTERILVLGVTPLARQVIAEIEARPRRREIVGVVDEGEFTTHGSADIAYLQQMIDRLQPHRIIVALNERRGHMPMRALLDSRLWRGVIVEDVADTYERLTGRIALESLTPMSIIMSGRFCPPAVQQIMARLLGVIIASLVLCTTAPLLALVALAVRLDSPGPIFFRQRRIGLYGRPFTLIKFRTMRHDLARRSEWEGDNRDAVTRVGRWLRAFRIDELPQCLNILVGDMNLVGPRPHPITNFELFTLVARNLNELSGSAISCYELRTLIRPGLTGWAQVRYRYANNLEEELEKLRYDLYYVKHISFWLDLRILLETAKVLRGQTTREVTVSKPNRIRILNALRRSSFFVLAVMLASATPAFGQATRAARTTATAGEPAFEYIIGPDDELEVAVWNNQAVTRTVLVRPDGRISLPLANDVQAAGLTPMQLQGSIVKALAPFIQNPDVAVIVKAVRSYKVSVMGEVKEPGRFELSSRATVLDVLAMAKGFNEFADKGRIIVLRRENGVTKQYAFQYMKILSDNAESGRDNFFVQSGDIVLVR